MGDSGSSSMRLGEQLCFALHAASRATTGCYRPLLEEIGLTYTQYVVMLVLWEHDSVEFGFLCRELDLDSGSLSPVVKRIEARGLVARQRRHRDERTVQVSCTPAGHALQAGAALVHAQVESALGLSAAELTALRQHLDRLTRRLRSAGGDVRRPGDEDPVES